MTIIVRVGNTGLRRTDCQHYSLCLDEAVRQKINFNCYNCDAYEEEEQTEDEAIDESLRSCVLLLTIWPQLATVQDPTTFLPLWELLKGKDYGQDEIAI